MEMKRWLSQRHKNNIVGIDTESGGLSPYRDKMRMIQVGDTRIGWAIPEHWFGVAYEIIKEYQGDWVAHNSGYDFQVLHVNGHIDLPWNRLHDTSTAAHLIDTSRSRKLKVLADRLIDPRCSAGEYLLHDGMRKQGWTWETVPYDFDPYWIYSALDPVLTCLMWDKLKYAAELYKEPYELERSAIRYTTGMSIKGVRIDMPYVLRKIDELQEYQEKASLWLKDTYGITSVGSSMQISKTLKSLDIPIQFWTPSGQPQMDKYALLYYQNQEPDSTQFISTILKVRKASKMVSTYLENFRDKTTSDGRLHASIHPCQAKTSRMSISDPSLQNLPTDDELIRAAILADDDDSVLITCDYNQLEMRIAAHFSNDPNLIETFRKADQPGAKAFFLQVAEDIFNEVIEKKDKRYGLTKNVAYGYLFGAGLEKMSMTAGVKQEQMSPVRNAFMQQYAQLEVMSQKIIAESKINASEDGRPYVLTPTGRKLTAEPGKNYTLVNFKIQGHAAEILKESAGRAEELDILEFIRLPVHDEFLSSVPKDQAEEVRHLTEQAMRADGYRLPITAGADIIGERWVKV